MEAVVLGNGLIRVRATIVKSLSSLVTISSGGSIGREGSMVQLASMLGSLLGRTAKFSPARLRLLVACGAAAAGRPKPLPAASTGGCGEPGLSSTP